MISVQTKFYINSHDFSLWWLWCAGRISPLVDYSLYILLLVTLSNKQEYNPLMPNEISRLVSLAPLFLIYGYLGDECEECLASQQRNIMRRSNHGHMQITNDLNIRVFPNFILFQCSSTSWRFECKAGKSVPLQARGAQRVPGSYRSQITWQRPRMVVRLSASHTGTLLPPGNTPGTNFY